MILRNDKGAVLLEFLLSMPLLFVMIMTVLQFAHIWMARQVVKYAAYCAARSTLTCNQTMAHTHARAAAKMVCAWITFSEPASELARIRAGRASSADPFLRDVSYRNAEGTVSDLNAVKSQVSRQVENLEMKVPGWGGIPGSSSLDRRIRVYAGNTTMDSLDLLHRLSYPWKTRATVEFDFPLLMPVVGKMLSYIVKRDYAKIKSEYNNGSLGFHPVSGWTGQKEVIDSERGYKEHALPYITLRETCILPRPYSTNSYPVTSACLELSRGGF